MREDKKWTNSRVPARWKVSGMEVYVVTITTRSPVNCYDFAAKVFSSEDGAKKWIETQIDELVAKHGLQRDNAVDGWHVEIDTDSSVQFDVEVQSIL